MFADDIKLYLVIRSPDDCLQQQHDRDVLAQWSKRWLLSFNVIKCKVLHIGNSSVHCSHQCTLQEDAFNLLDDVCDLGIIIDPKLKFHLIVIL